MFKLLIFGGTTEGRQLAEYCAENGINADVSVATEYGASLLPAGVDILCGRLDAEQMKVLVSAGYSAVVDATHPYAVEATENIKLACENAGVRRFRLVRKSSVSCGKTAADMEELIAFLNASDGVIFSTLGSKSLPALTGVRNFRERIWVRVLPGAEILSQCRELGYDTAKIVQEQGPFTTEQNVEQLRKSGAKLLLTKESGAAGGYPEKAEAARICGAELITLARPAESGFGFGELIRIIERERGK